MKLKNHLKLFLLLSSVLFLIILVIKVKIIKILFYTISKGFFLYNKKPDLFLDLENKFNLAASDLEKYYKLD